MGKRANKRNRKKLERKTSVSGVIRKYVFSALDDARTCRKNGASRSGRYPLTRAKNLNATAKLQGFRLP